MRLLSLRVRLRFRLLLGIRDMRNASLRFQIAQLRERRNG
jgi:hypothetical protein